MNRPELTFEEFCQLPLTLSMHISGDKEHYLSKINKEAGVQRITITKVKKNGDFGVSHSVFTLAGDERVFKTADQVYVAYMEQVCGVTK